MIVSLRDGDASAQILVSLGFNCFQWQVPGQDGPIDLLWSEPTFADGQGRPSGSGIPLLFPFPGRIGGGVLDWRGKSLTIPGDDGRGNAIHGFAYDRPWRLVSSTDQEATGEFHASVDAPEVLPHWTADFRLRVTYRLQGGRLECEVVADNPDDRDLFCGFGAHPYFRIAAVGDDCVVTAPVASQWVLDEMIPSGERRPVRDGLPSGQAFAGMQYDDVFGELQMDGDGECRSFLEGRDGSRIELTCRRPFRELVVYTPPHREAICIEPYSCVPGDPTLSDAGWQVLAPGESQTYHFAMEYVPAGSQRA